MSPLDRGQVSLPRPRIVNHNQEDGEVRHAVQSFPILAHALHRSAERSRRQGNQDQKGGQAGDNVALFRQHLPEGGPIQSVIYYGEDKKMQAGI